MSVRQTELKILTMNDEIVNLSTCKHSRLTSILFVQSLPAVSVRKIISTTKAIISPSIAGRYAQQQ